MIFFQTLEKMEERQQYESYDPEVPVSQYRRAFNRYYDSGRYASDIGVAEKSAYPYI